MYLAYIELQWNKVLGLIQMQAYQACTEFCLKIVMSCHILDQFSEKWQEIKPVI